MKFNRDIKNKVESEENKIFKRQIIFLLVIIAVSIMLTLIVRDYILNIRVKNNFVNQNVAEELVSINKELNKKVNQNDNTLEETISILREVDEIYREKYIGNINDIDANELKITLTNAMIEVYGDKYGVYLTPELAEESDNSELGLLYGIGVLIRAEMNSDEKLLNQLYVINTYDNSGAEEVGITKGCSIIAVNGEDFEIETEREYRDLIDRIKGKEGTYVNLTYVDTDGVEHTVDVERRKIETNTVEYEIMNDTTAYINITEFKINTSEEFKKILAELKIKGISNYIFDLRDNPGGMLTAVTQMLDTLLPKGDIIYVEDAYGNIIQVFKSDDNHINFNSVCLVNENTASAAEMFTQTLKESNKTTVIGTTTYGKGTVCGIINTSDGGSLQVSTNRYLTISKNCLEGIGVIPDIEMKLPEDKLKIAYKLSKSEDDLIQRALEELK